MTGYFINFIVYTMAMVGLLFLCLMVYKKANLNNKCSKNAEELSIENALNLSQRKTLYVIKAGKEKFLIAADTERTSFLAKLEDNESKNNKTEYMSYSSIKTEPIIETTRNKPVDYSEVMNSIKGNTNKNAPVMKEMLRKLSEPILKENK